MLRPLLKQKFQVVVGNPPYITERDPARKEYHREKVGKKRRYVSAYREYSLAAPFIERCLQLAVADGWIGLIVGNNFVKREFGKPLVEEVLAGSISRWSSTARRRSSRTTGRRLSSYSPAMASQDPKRCGRSWANAASQGCR
ncbi:MAG: Eco57I restriction-modification methylase domain-containing protein [Kofleriaceae bacterium]